MKSPRTWVKKSSNTHLHFRVGSNDGDTSNLVRKMTQKAKERKQLVIQDVQSYIKSSKRAEKILMQNNQDEVRGIVSMR